MISDPQTPDGYVRSAISSIRRYPTDEVPSQFWSDIANSGLYTIAQRRWAVLQLIDRYAQPQWTLRELGNLLASPTWLRQEEITYIDVPTTGAVPAPSFPTDLEPTDSLIGIRVCLPTMGGDMIYLRMRARPDPKDVYTALMGNPSPADNIQVTEIAPVFYGAGGIGGFHWRGGEKSPYDVWPYSNPPDESAGEQ